MKRSTAKILVYFVIFLTVLNLATIITIGIHVVGSKSDEVEVTDNTGGSGSDFSGRYFRDRLQLNQVQMKSFQRINDRFRSDAREINQRLIQQRQQMFQEMKKTPPDTMDLDAYSDSIGKLHNALKRSTYSYYLGIKGICSEEQLIELDRIFEEFFINDFQPGRHGKQGNHGNRGQGGPKRYGQQRNNLN